MSVPSIGIIVSTTRRERFGHIPAEWAYQIGRQRNDLSFEMIDLRDHSLPMFDESAPPACQSSSNAEVRRWLERVRLFDGYIFVTAEYNHSIPAVLKNAMDYCYSEFSRKPALFLGYGGLGAARAVEQLRLICIELGMAPIRAGVHIGVETYLAVSKKEKALMDIDFLNASANEAMNELAWWTHALKEARQAQR
ncbi:NADPH-dependent FMN reductase [Luteimonas sp. SDU101]|uniref:NADPH-dependent FMN reductase n=1 Tax=unclassified Luteimonas TaxID=2629088 RepID=UPI003EB8521F